MAKGDSAQASSMVNNAQSRNNQLYNSMYNNYGAGVSRDLPTYDSLLGNYNNFLGGRNPAGGVGGTPSSGVGGYSGNAQNDISAAEQKLGWSGNFNQYRGQTDKLAAALGPGWKGGGAKADDWLQDPNGQGYDVITSGGQPSFALDNTGQGGQQQSNIQAIPGWQNFAETGGFTPQSIQDIRARSVAPIRAGYQYAADEMARNRALGGNYSPNFNASMAKMARDQGYATSDAMTNADAAIAQLKQQGQLYGLSGLTNAQLGAMNAMTNLYGTNPGLSQTFGNQALGAGNQGINLIDALVRSSQIPSKFNQIAGNASTAGNLLKGLLGGSGGSAGGNQGGLVNQMMNRFNKPQGEPKAQFGLPPGSPGDYGNETGYTETPFSGQQGNVDSNWYPYIDPNTDPGYYQPGGEGFQGPTEGPGYQTDYLGGSGNYPGQQGYQSAYYDPFMNYGEGYYDPFANMGSQNTYFDEGGMYV